MGSDYPMMMDNKVKVSQAADIWRRSSAYGPEQWEETIKLLATHGLWSKAQIITITGAPRRIVDRFIDKQDRTGGRLNPATLELVVEEFEEDSSPQLTATIIRYGTSAGMLGKLLGESTQRVLFRAGKGGMI